MEEVINLNMFSESRGDLYVVESNSNYSLNYTNYYVVNCNIDLNTIDSIFSLIVIRGEITINEVLLHKGNMIFDVIGGCINHTEDFIALIMTNSVLNIQPLHGLNFKVERVFFVDNMPVGSIRGQHAHSHETEFLYSVKGDFDIVIKNVGAFDGIISEGGTALSLPNAWTSVESMSEGGILLAFLTHKYDADGFHY